MSISEKKMKIVIDNYFKSECQYLDDDEATLGIDERPCYCPLYKSEPQWIPCSERLPEEGTEVLGTDDHGCIRHVVKDKSASYEFATYEEMMHIDIVAWQPLPKPYKEGEQ